MSALLILLVLGLWGATLYYSAYYLTFFIKKKWIRQLIGTAAVIGLFTLPVRDEIKGADEFEALCKTGGVYQIAPNAVGKKFDLKFSATENKNLLGYSRPIEESIISYTDVATGEVVATVKTYVAGPGWLVRDRWLPSPSGGSAPLNGRPQCSPSDEERRRLRAITNRVIN